MNRGQILDQIRAVQVAQILVQVAQVSGLTLKCLWPYPWCHSSSLSPSVTIIMRFWQTIIEHLDTACITYSSFTKNKYLENTKHAQNASIVENHFICKLGLISQERTSGEIETIDYLVHSLRSVFNRTLMYIPYRRIVRRNGAPEMIYGQPDRSNDRNSLMSKRFSSYYYPDITFEQAWKRSYDIPPRGSQETIWQQP